MKKLALMVLALLVMLLISTTVHARPVVNPEDTLFCTNDTLDDNLVGKECATELFTTKFWKEKFFSGGPGQPGNVIMAIGKGFVLQNLVLQDSPISCDDPSDPCDLPADDPCFVADPGLAWQYATPYEGGMLTLNSKGPWLDKGMLKAKGFTATNYSRHDGEGNLLGFCMAITGEFRNAPYSFNAWALFDATVDNYQFKVDDEGKPVFQRGYDFNAVIEIFEP